MALRICMLNRSFIHEAVVSPAVSHKLVGKRTSMVFKRVYEPRLYKQEKPITIDKLKERHFVYTIVEDTRSKAREDIELILTKYVEGLGYPGDVVKVGRRHARMKLLPLRMAVYATPDNLKEFTDGIKQEGGKERKKISPFAWKTAKMLPEVPVQVFMNAHHHWMLEPKHIRIALRIQGLTVLDDCSIVLPEETITTPQSVEVKITVNDQYEVPLRVDVLNKEDLLSA